MRLETYDGMESAFEFRALESLTPVLSLDLRAIVAI